MTPIQLYEFFLTKSQMQKLIIWDNLVTGSVKKSTLEAQLKISKRQIKLSVIALEEELAAEFPNYTGNIIFHKEKIEIENITDSRYILLKNSLRYKYFSMSGMFRLLLFILEKRIFSVWDISESLFYSESYVYKLLTRLKLFFQSIDVKIQIDKKNEIYFYLKGDESKIRIIHYLSVSLISKERYWLFTTINKEEILTTQMLLNNRTYSKLSPFGKSRVDSIAAVYECALRTGNQVELSNDAVIGLGKIIISKKEVPIQIKYLKEVGEEKYKILYKEIIHFAFLSNYFIQELRSKDEKEILGRELSLFQDNSIINVCLKLLNEIRKSYDLPDSSYYILLYSLCNRLVVIHYLKLSIFMPLYGVPPLLTKMEKDVERCIEITLHPYSKAHSYTKIKYNFIQIITGYLLLANPVENKVYVEFFHRPEYKSIIENRIAYNYNSKVLQVTGDYSEANIVISDIYMYEEKKQFFYFADVFNQESWGKLGFYLNQLINKESKKNT